jgi:hypothetical protein
MNMEPPLEIALRVLRAICSHTEPQQSDVEALVRSTEKQEERLMPINDLACAVIVRERKRLQEKTLAARY